MIGAAKPPIKHGSGRNKSCPGFEETAEERQERFSLLQNKKLQSIINEIAGHLGHWADSKLPQDCFNGGNRYEPAMRFPEAVSDLKKMLMQNTGSLNCEANEEVARLMEGAGIIQKHLAPLFVSLPLSRFLDSSLHIIEIFNVLLEAQSRWEYQDDHLYTRQVLKKVLSHKKIFERLLYIFVAILQKEEPKGLSLLFNFIKNVLAVPDATDAFRTANGLSQADFGRSDQVIRGMQISGLLEFLLAACSSVEQNPFRSHALIICEIWTLIFSVFNPVKIAAKKESGPASGLNEELDKEAPIKKPIRHANFSGSIVFKLSTGQDYILRQGSYFNGKLDLDNGKRSRRIGGRPQQALTYKETATRVSLADMQLAEKLADDFLASCFNILVRHLLTDELSSRINDDKFHSSFLRLATWFLSYVRVKAAKFSSIFSIFDTDALQQYARLLPRFHEEFKRNGDLLLTAVVFFRELFRMIELLALPAFVGETETHKAAANVQNTLFYRMEMLQSFRLIIQTLKKHTIQSLTILVETVHVLMKLLEGHCRSGGVYVAAQSRRRRTADDDSEENSQETERIEERLFEFKQYVMEWANEPILLAYTHLLLNASRNSVNLNRYLAVMFFRLHQATDGSLFHKAFFLDATHRFLHGNRKAVLIKNAGLVKILSGIVGGFFRAMRDDPILLVEAFFPHMIRSTVVSVPGLISSCVVDSEGESEDAEDELTLPQGLDKDQRIRALVRRLVDQEMNQTVLWLCSFLEACTDATSEPSTMIAESDSQKRALRNTTFTCLLRALGVKPPSASLKFWHLAVGADLSKDLEYLRHTFSEALNDGADGNLGARLAKQKLSADIVDSGDESEETEELCSESVEEESDFSISEALENDQEMMTKPANYPAPQQPQPKMSKFQEKFRSGFFAALPPSNSALPLSIVDEDLVSDAGDDHHGLHTGDDNDANDYEDDVGTNHDETAAKKTKARVIDSDSE